MGWVLMVKSKKGLDYEFGSQKIGSTVDLKLRDYWQSTSHKDCSSCSIFLIWGVGFGGGVLFFKFLVVAYCSILCFLRSFLRLAFSILR